MWLYIIIVVLLILVIVELYFRFRRAGRLIRKIPGPKSLPICGNILSNFLPPEKLFLFHRSLPKLYGGISQIHALNFRLIHVANAEDIEKLLSAPSGNHKENPISYLTSWLGQGLLLSNGKYWTQRRKMLTKAFNFNIIQKFFVTFVEETDYFLQRVEEEIGKDRTDLFALMSSTTLRIMCATAMGTKTKEIQSLISKYLSSVEIIGDCFTKRWGSVWLHSDTIYKLTNMAKKEEVAVKYLKNLTDNIIKIRKELLAKKEVNNFDHDDDYESNEKMAMLDLLLENEKAGILDHQGVREEVDTFMFAGHDTTAIAMTYMLMALANQPEIQEKVYAEICEVLGDRSPTTEDLNQLKYMECCIKESIRLYPSAPAITRHIQNEIVLGGYTVPANTAALILIHDLHRRPEVFPEPDRFIPERFLPENSIKRHPFAYIPFGAGPRYCIGQKFAMMEMKTIMCKLLRKYRLEPVTRPEDIVFKTDIVLRAAHPIYVKFCAR